MSKEDKNVGCLIVSRKVGERILIGEDIVLEVIECTNYRTRIMIKAPRTVKVYREELKDKIDNEGYDPSKDKGVSDVV